MYSLRTLKVEKYKEQFLPPLIENNANRFLYVDYIENNFLCKFGFPHDIEAKVVQNGYIIWIGTIILY